MAITSRQIVDFLLANPGMSDADIATAMQTYNVTSAQMAAAVGVPVADVQARYKLAAPSVYTAENVNKLADQILSQGTTEAWTGGLPPATAARYMADELAQSGVTDITQVAKGETGIINVMTGDKLISGYGERTKDNLWSGSYEGKGNTGFGVSFDAQDKPVFYTQGASSSTLKKDILTLAAVAGAIYGLGGFEGLLGGTASGAGATGLTLAELGGTAGAGALTAGEAAALYGTGASALGTAGVIGSDLAGLSGIPAGTGALTAAEAASLYGTGSALGGAGVIGSDLAGLSGIPAGTGALTAAESAALYGTGGLTTGALTAGGVGTVAGMGAGTGITAGAGGLGLSTTGAGLGAAGTGAGITAGAGLTGTGVLAGSGLGTTLLGTTTGALTGTGVLTGSGLGTTLLGTGAGTGVTGGITTGVGAGTLGAGALTTGVGAGLGTGLGGLTAAQLGALLSGGLTTAGGLLQQQTSREAAIAAQAMIDRETAAAKQAAQFRPVGMTTRFGTSQFQVDPVTGRLTSAGYTLSPEAKNAQDRLVKLAESGLVQTEGAQAQFAPLQTGAQSLFSLGNQYLAKSPQDVAQNYLNQQMALLQPGRELDLATLQNKLQQQGRGGLSVAQGGTYGATTPELQALFNARAKQEAELAAYAQQAGQKDVLFGAGLLGQGSTAMGNYYAGQKAAYDPYTTALTQIKDLETLGQKPFTMSTDLAQQVAQSGANVGQLGLRGAEQSVALATGKAATTNPYSTLLGGLGSSPAFGTAAGNALYSLFS